MVCRCGREARSQGGEAKRSMLADPGTRCAVCYYTRFPSFNSHLSCEKRFSFPTLQIMEAEAQRT